MFYFIIIFFLKWDKSSHFNNFSLLVLLSDVVLLLVLLVVLVWLFFGGGRTIGTTADVNPMTWWPNHVTELPTFASVAKRIALLAPTSAESERVFSLLKSHISNRQHHLLQESLEATLMLKYNNRNK